MGGKNWKTNPPSPVDNLKKTTQQTADCRLQIADHKKTSKNFSFFLFFLRRPDCRLQQFSERVTQTDFVSYRPLSPQNTHTLFFLCVASRGLRRELPSKSLTPRRSQKICDRGRRAEKLKIFKKKRAKQDKIKGHLHFATLEEILSYISIVWFLVFWSRLGNTASKKREKKVKKWWFLMVYYFVRKTSYWNLELKSTH